MRGNRVIIQTYAVGASVAVAILSAALFAAPIAQAEAEPKTAGSAPIVRRLTENQYRQIIHDVFGSAINVGGRFEPDIREEYLEAIGASRVSITASGLEEYDKIARHIAEQVVSEEFRSELIPCEPISAKRADDKCAHLFIGMAGRLLYRRALTDNELNTRVSLAALGAKRTHDFYQGLGLALVAILNSPEFLFRVETTEGVVGEAEGYHLDNYSMASRLSFFLWNAGPDPALLDAAERGELTTSHGLSRQVDRMMDSPRLESGVRAFFIDMFGFKEFSTVDKDGVIFPKYSSAVERDAQEQTLRTIVDVLIARRADYRDIFTTRKTFLSRALASIYGVSFTGEQGGWSAFEFPEGDPREGLLTHVSFVALHSHPGRTSPTLRGKALRELMLCQKVPAPPGDVDFSIVQNTNSVQHKTARARLNAHATEPMCAGCHKITDPLGLALENFDSSGEFRTTENGVGIDTSGEFGSVAFDGPIGLGRAIRESGAAPNCVVNRLYSYGVGRIPAESEKSFLTYLQREFADGGYRFPDLLRLIATSEAFYRAEFPNTKHTRIEGARLNAIEISSTELK